MEWNGLEWRLVGRVGVSRGGVGVEVEVEVEVRVG